MSEGRAVVTLGSQARSVTGAPFSYLQGAIVASLLIAIIGYGWGVSWVPVRGEETRWALGAEWMLHSGDWIVPRQQGNVFPERPPLNSWLMAAIGVVRGWVDPVAVRVPSILAVLGTMLLVYWYARRSTDRSTGWMAAVIYGSFGQVLQLGRRGESEAVFTLLLAASLLVWHRWWEDGKSAWRCWTAGFSLAALAALSKGLQAPVYFITATMVYLWWTGRWSAVFSRAFLGGVMAFAAIVGAWFVPFVWMTDWQSAHDIWLGLARDRVGTSGLLRHMATYPFETFGCLLPWSPLLLQFAYRCVRQQQGTRDRQLTFLLVSLLVTYPSMLLAVGARGRYYMPLYPLVALLIAEGIRRTMRTRDGWSRAGFLLWQFTVCGVMIALPVLLLGIAADSVSARWHVDCRPLRPALWLLLAGALATAGLIVAAARGRLRWEVPPWAIGGWLMLAYGLLWYPIVAQQLGDLTETLADQRTRHRIESLRSLGPVYHRFLYYYREPVKEEVWPLERAHVPADLDFFCFDVSRNDTNQRKACGRGRSGRSVPGTLPFRWIEIARINCDPLPRGPANRTVVIGRVVRDARGRIAWHDRFPAVDLSRIPPVRVARKSDTSASSSD